MSKSRIDRLKWRRMRFKNHKVWQATDGRGRPLETNGKVLIKYRLEQDYEYWVHPANLVPVEAPGQAPPLHARHQTGTGTGMEKTMKPPPPNTVHIYTDGASSGNPGPAGIGVVLEYGDESKEISKFIGHTTNNVAELEAIRTGLLKLRRKNLPVRIYTDSSYAHGVLSLGWEARKNRELVAEIRDLLSALGDVAIVKVRGHAGHEQNERADQLARAAVATGGRR